MVKTLLVLINHVIPNPEKGKKHENFEAYKLIDNSVFKTGFRRYSMYPSKITFFESSIDPFSPVIKSAVVAPYRDFLISFTKNLIISCGVTPYIDYDKSMKIESSVDQAINRYTKKEHNETAPEYYFKTLFLNNEKLRKDCHIIYMDNPCINDHEATSSFVSWIKDKFPSIQPYIYTLIAYPPTTDENCNIDDEFRFIDVKYFIRKEYYTHTAGGRLDYIFSSDSCIASAIRQSIENAALRNILMDGGDRYD